MILVSFVLAKARVAAISVGKVAVVIGSRGSILPTLATVDELAEEARLNDAGRLAWTARLLPRVQRATQRAKGLHSRLDLLLLISSLSS